MVWSSEKSNIESNAVAVYQILTQCRPIPKLNTLTMYYVLNKKNLV